MRISPRIVLLLLLLGPGHAAPASAQRPDCPRLHAEYRRIQVELDTAFATMDFADQFFLVQGTLDETIEALEGTSEDAEAVADKLEQILPQLRRLQVELGDGVARVAGHLDEAAEVMASLSGVLQKASSALNLLEDLVRARDGGPRQSVEHLGAYFANLVTWVEPLVASIPGLGAFLQLYALAFERTAEIAEKLTHEVVRRNQIYRQAGGEFDLYIQPANQRQAASARVEALEAQLEAAATRLVEDCGGVPERQGDPVEAALEAQLADAAGHCRQHALARLQAVEERNRLANHGFAAAALRVTRAEDRLHTLGVARQPPASLGEGLRAQLARVEELEARQQRSQPLSGQEVRVLLDTPPSARARIRNLLAALEDLEVARAAEVRTRQAFRDADRAHRQASQDYWACQQERLQELASTNAWDAGTRDQVLRRLGPRPPSDYSDTTGLQFDLAGAWRAEGHRCQGRRQPPLVVDVHHRLGETSVSGHVRSGGDCGPAGARSWEGVFNRSPFTTLLQVPGDSGVTTIQAQIRILSHDHFRIEHGRNSRIDMRRLALVLEGEETIVAPGRGQTGPGPAIRIDCTGIPEGKVHVRLEVGDGESAASFSLRDWATRERLDRAYDIIPGTTRTMAHRFEGGGVFVLSGLGNYFSRKGSTNQVRYQVLVTR